MPAFRRPLHVLAIASLLGTASLAHAQAAAAPAAAKAPANLPAPDAEKQKLIDRILVVFHPEVGILQAVQKHGLDVMQQSSIAMQTAHVPPERKDKALKEIGADVQKYIDTTMPMAVATAKKDASPAVGPILAQNFTTDELRQIAALLESPLKQRFDKLVPRMEDAVGDKVQADISAQVNANTKTLVESAGTKLRIAATPQ